MFTNNNPLQPDKNLATMSSMGLNQRGFMNALVVPLLVVTLLLVGSAAFGIWAFAGRQDYKSNSDQKVATAVEETKTATQATEAAKYAEEAKNPLKTFVGPSDFGSVTFQYPKTWSGYVITAASGDSPLDGFFHPDTVPDVEAESSVFALRVAVVNDAYSEVLDSFAGNVQSGKVTVSPFKLAKLPSVIGSQVQGEIEQGKKGTMVLFPLRNVTLKVWTNTDQYLADFNNTILPNLSFSP